MLTLLLGIITNYWQFVDSFIGLDYVVGFLVVVLAIGWIHSLTKNHGML